MTHRTEEPYAAGASLVAPPVEAEGASAGSGGADDEARPGGAQGRRHDRRRRSHPRGRPALTAREAEVARLAAARWTDREIAGALVVSVRTVESHLASAYRKLGIGSRRRLAPLVAGDWRELPPPPPPSR